MTSTETTARTDRAKIKKTVLSALGGGVVGMIGASGIMYLISSGKLGQPDLSQVVALLVALVYALTGLIVLAGLISPEAGSRFLNVEDADELREQKGALTASGWAMLLLGALLAVIALGGTGGVLAAPVALAIAAVLIAAATYLSVRSMRQLDELMRAMSAESAQVTYYAIFLILGGWAALAHLGYVTAPGMLDVLTLFWVMGLGATFWVTGRRGLLNPR